MEQFQLLRSKLYRPRIADDVVHRPRALEMLNRHLDRSVTLVCAPAGFGKTTLLSDWLGGCPAPSAWLSLDEYDSDLDRFVSYFVAAVRTISQSACADTVALLRAPILPPLSALLTTLSNDLDRMVDDASPFAEDCALSQGQRFILVLDDYHLIRGQDVHTLVGELLQHPPRAFHLVLSARIDPPFPIHALRARGDMTEIRMPELRFTRPEIEAFMERALGTPLGADALLTMMERSEGWVTGLRLAALTMSAGGELPGPPPEAATDNRYVLDYLLNEVLSRVPISTQDFLLKTAILERLSGPLCDAVTGWAGPEWDGSGYLEWLADENLFTFSLDEEGTWYRYHHLFRSLLRKRLERQHSKEEIADCHRRASAWFSQNGLVEEAIQHALAAGDELGVVRLVEAHRHEAMNQEQWRRVARWLRLIPQPLIESRPELLMLDAWLLQQQWRFADLPARLDRIEALIEQATEAGTLPDADRTRLSSEVDCLRCAIFYYGSDIENTRVRAERALRSAPMQCSFVRAYAWYYYAASRQMTGDVQGALDALNEGLKEDRFHGNAFPMRLYGGLGNLHLMRTDLPNLLLTASQLLEMGRLRDLGEAASWGHYLLGCAFYLMDRLAEAEEAFAAAFSLPYVAHAFVFANGGFGLASVMIAEGEFERARETVDALAGYALETANNRIMADAESFRAWLAIQTGAVAAAQHWAETYDLNTPPVPMLTFYVARMTLARILVRLGTARSLSQAAELLNRVHEIASSTGNTRILIEELALQALVKDAHGDRPGAFQALKRAVLLGEPGGAIRIFVDLGSRMRALLGQLSVRGIAPGYLRTLLAAFREEKEPQPARGEPAPERLTTNQAAGGNGHRGTDGLIEPLSGRELEVLELLGQWLTNKEIARELNISPQTVKRHTVNIYQKLAVNTRRDAVAAGVTLGLLDPPERPRSRLESRK